jgi:hypothetical protein
MLMGPKEEEATARWAVIFTPKFLYPDIHLVAERVEN